jgi:hypothetical protein
MVVVSLLIGRKMPGQIREMETPTLHNCLLKDIVLRGLHTQFAVGQVFCPVFMVRWPVVLIPVPIAVI